MEKLSESRERFFHETKQPFCVNPWLKELPRVRGTDAPQPALDAITTWNPCGRDAHANCPELDARVREIKTLVDPRWRARVGAIYAGRGPYQGELAVSLKHPKSSLVFISFAYSYATVGAFIVLGDFFNFIDAAAKDDHVGWRSGSLRQGKLDAFARLLRGDFRGSGIFQTTAQVKEAASHTSQWAELFIVGHEVGHLILKDSSSRPDKAARAEVDAILSRTDLAAEAHGLSPNQLNEVRADVLALLIVAGEYKGDSNLQTEIAAVEGAMLALIAMGLVDGDWTASEDHPSTLTRLSVVAKIAADRILARPEGSQEDREELVRALAVRLAYAAWLSGSRVAPGIPVDPDDSPVLFAQTNTALAATALFLPAPFRLFRAATENL